MLNRSKPSSRGRKTIESSFHGLATVLALIAALAVSVPIFQHTYEPAYDYFLATYYEETLAHVGAFTFGTLCVAAVFYIARIFIVISLMLIASRVVMFAM